MLKFLPEDQKRAFVNHVGKVDAEDPSEAA
jgi:hypothetical protein